MDETSGPDRELLAALAALPRSAEPERDLWPSVAAQLPPRRAWWTRWEAAAAAIALVALSSGITAWLTRPPPPLPWEAQMLAAAEQLEAEIAAGDLPPELERRLLDDAAELEAAILELRRALDERPDDPRLAAALGAAHRHRLELLRLAATL